MTMAMHAAARAVNPMPPRSDENEEIQLFRSIKLRVQMKFQALIIRALDVSGVLECYGNFNLTVQVRNKKISAWTIEERVPVISPKPDSET